MKGLPEHLFERLTTSPAEPYLKALQELFINFWGASESAQMRRHCIKVLPLAIEAQAFTVRDPGAFFNMYSPPRSDTSYKPLRDRLHEELRFMSKMVGAIVLSHDCRYRPARDRYRTSA